MNELNSLKLEIMNEFRRKCEIAKRHYLAEPDSKKASILNYEASLWHEAARDVERIFANYITKN